MNNSCSVIAIVSAMYFCRSDMTEAIICQPDSVPIFELGY